MKINTEKIFKNDLVHIFHIGSTSIPTVHYAKPIIDILLVVMDINKVELYIRELEELKYIAKGECGIRGRRYFSKGEEKRTHHLHIYQVGNKNIKTHLDFKEYLLNNPLEAKKYGEIKVNLSKQFPFDHEKYQEGEQEIANELVFKAKERAIKKQNPKLIRGIVLWMNS